MFKLQNEYTYDKDGFKLLNLTLDQNCFFFNSIAMGDLIASVPVVKYMIDTYYTTPDSYMVVAKQKFKSLFPFVPDANFHDFDDRVNMWGVPSAYSVGRINKSKEHFETRLTPKHLHLSQFAAIALAGRIIDPKYLNYVSLDPVDITHFNIDFTKAVILISSYRDLTRAWHSDYILSVAKWVKSQELIPIFIGKTDENENHKRESIKPKTSLPTNVAEYGVDLRNKTSIEELASIFKVAKAVCGVDSGPIHLAGTTAIPIVCGYTSVSSEHRIPYRKEGITIAIEPKIECIGCESRWRSNFWNFENCYLEHINCCIELTADKYISALKEIF